jgi:hypothetical protein
MIDQGFTSELKLSPEEVGKTIESALPSLDSSQSGHYEGLARMRDAKARSLAREGRWLTIKHGGAIHPRMAEAEQRFAINEQARREVAVVREAAETPAPEIHSDSVLVHGFVRRRSDRSGIPGLTIALTDRNGNWLRSLGYACTDVRGYFALRAVLSGRKAASDVAETLKAAAGISVEEARRQAEAKAGLSGSTSAGEATARLCVFDPKGKVLKGERQPVALQRGTLDYRLILLGDETTGCACSPPPAKAGSRPGAAGPKAAPRPSVVAGPGSANQPPARVSNLKKVMPPLTQAEQKAPTAAEQISTEKPVEAKRSSKKTTAD